MDDTPRGQRVRSPETWEQARADYLSGLSAAQVCNRYDLTQAALRKRAEREGWRRSDQPDPEPPAACEPAPDRAPALTADLQRRARLGLEDALAAGRVLEARHWLRVHADLIALARDEQASPPPTPEAEQLLDALAELRALNARKLTADVRRDIAQTQAALPAKASTPVHPVHHVHDVAAEKRPAQSLNRHDRRKRARLAEWKARQEGRGRAE